MTPVLAAAGENSRNVVVLEKGHPLFCQGLGLFNGFPVNRYGEATVQGADPCTHIRSLPWNPRNRTNKVTEINGSSEF